jgi:YtfJ family uncharacterized protein
MKLTPLHSFVLVFSIVTITQSVAVADTSAVSGTSVLHKDAGAFYADLDIGAKSGSNAITLQTGKALPALDIDVGGEISIAEDNVVKRPWSSSSFENKGKVQLVQYIAANRGAMRENKLFNDTLIAKRYNSQQMSTTVIVNMSDTLFFAKGFVLKKIAKSKGKHQSISFVLDDRGLGLERWGVKKKSCAIIVLDGDGKVLFAKNGPLTETETKQALELIDGQIV